MLLKKIWLFSILILGLINSSLAQVDETKSQDTVFLNVETSPEYPGGMVAFSKFIGKNLKYPSYARKIGVQGKVFVEFIVDTDGSIIGVKLLKGIGAGCDEEAMRVIARSPKWTPGTQKGVPVKVRMSIPIIYQTTSEDYGDYLVVVDGKKLGSIQENRDYLKSLKKEDRIITEFLSPKQAQLKFGKKVKSGALIIRLNKK